MVGALGQFRGARKSIRASTHWPSNSRGFGTPDTTARVFGRSEIRPLQDRFAALNDWIGEEVTTFDEYEIPSARVGA